VVKDVVAVANGERVDYMLLRYDKVRSYRVTPSEFLNCVRSIAAGQIWFRHECDIGLVCR